MTRKRSAFGEWLLEVKAESDWVASLRDLAHERWPSASEKSRVIPVGSNKVIVPVMRTDIPWNERADFVWSERLGCWVPKHPPFKQEVIRLEDERIGLSNGTAVCLGYGERSDVIIVRECA